MRKHTANDSNKIIELNITGSRERLQKYEGEGKVSQEIENQGFTMDRLIKISTRMTSDEKDRFIKGLFLYRNGKITIKEVAAMTYGV